MDGGARMTVVHYLNQFFAGLGGEEAADHEPVRLEGPQGPGKALEAAGLHVDLTVACGDDRFGVHEDDCLATLLGWIDEADADVLVCGPSFGSGRYGYACGVLARELGRRGIPVVAAMTSDSPGVLASRGRRLHRADDRERGGDARLPCRSWRPSHPVSPPARRSGRRTKRDTCPAGCA